MVQGGRDFSASSNSKHQPGTSRKGGFTAMPSANPIFMTIQDIRISFETYHSIEELASQDAELLQRAQKATSDAYAPYSRFRVGAAGRLSDGAVVTGSNQENASFPAGLCAERVLLSASASFHPELNIETMAISYEGDGIDSGHPLAPCGVCRQALVEHEERYGKPIRLILAGMHGAIQIFSSASSLLPMRFSGKELPQ
jgi:cytidine deaminase